MKKRFVVIALVLVVSTMAWASGAPEPAEDFVQTEWDIPFLNVLTGPIASIGEYLQWGAERAAQEINDAGGINGVPVKVLRIDTGMDPNQGVVEMSKIVEGNYIAALGPVPEPVIMASMPIAVENGLYSMTATTSYEYAAQFFPWSISWFAKTEEKLPPAVQAWIQENDGMGSVVQFVENYGPWPGMAAAHEIALNIEGVEVLNTVEVPQDAVTFGPLIVKALEQNPDGIIFSANAEKVAKMIVELKNRGWEDMNRILVFNSADDAPLYTTGGDALDGVMIYNYINPEYSSARWDAFKAAYAAEHNAMSPPSLSTHYYDAVYMLAEAIEATGVTGNPAKRAEERAAVAEYCNNVEGFKGLLFNWSMDNGVPTDKPIYLFEIQGGEKQLVREIRPDDF